MSCGRVCCCLAATGQWNFGQTPKYNRPDRSFVPFAAGRSMATPTPPEFAAAVSNLGLAPRREVDAAVRELGVGENTLDQVVQVLQSRGLVTTLQTEKIMRGDRTGYFYGDYKVLYLIGAGTFARVYRAEKDGEVHAVKVLRKRFRDEVKEMEQFLREGRMGLKLKHPNIVQITDVVPDPRTPFLVMEFVEGQTLRQLVQVRGKLPPKLALELMHGVASGLKHAATFGIAHRDLKLSNVLISSDGKAKLVDFGLAALTDRNDPDKMADCPNARAIDYAALERGTNVRKDDPRSDVYFAGNMLYHMLAGEPALTETRDRLARLNVSRFSSIKPLHELVPDIPGAANVVVQKALEFDPDKRLQSPAALQAEIAKAIDALRRGNEVSTSTNGASQNASATPEELGNEGEGYVVMLVESKASLQDVIRERLKSRGYRVLITSDPRRALQRFETQDDVADIVVFGASELGNEAVDAYNAFADNDATAEKPCILLVDQKQTHVIRQARRGGNRILLPMPLKVRQLRAALLQLLRDTARREVGTY